MSTLRGIELLPPKITIEQSLELHKKVADINMQIGKLDSELKHSIVNSQLIQVLSLNESVQSTRIEGTQVTFADMIKESTKKNKSSQVIEVDNYMSALDEGVSLIKQDFPISTRLIKKMHRILMTGEARGTTSSAGEFRKVQNFIGPTNRMEDAVYIPINANEIDIYMSNLEHFINGENHRTLSDVPLADNEVVLDESSSPLLKIGILHAQFESIHPFLDGNGRLGRILIVLSAMQLNIIKSPVFFVSGELEKERLRYYNKLNGIRGKNPDWYSWLSFFLESCHRMLDSILKKLENITILVKQGLKKIDLPNNVISSVWMAMFTKPYMTVREVADGLNIAVSTARNSLNKLVDLELIDVDNSKTRNKVYVNYDLLRILG